MTGRRRAGDGPRRDWWSQPPGWAVAAMVVVAVVLVTAVSVTRGRGQVPASEIERAQKEDAAYRAEASASASASAAAASAAENPPPIPILRPPDRPLRVMFAGDSLTAGAFAMDADVGSFRAIITRELRARGPVDTTIVGGSGKTVAEAQPDLNRLKWPPDVAIVELGSNDIAERNAHQFTVEYPPFLDQLREIAPNTVLICTGAWESASVAEPFSQEIEDECAAHGGRFVPLQSIYNVGENHNPPGVLRPTGEKTDTYHPNDAGHAAIAAAILKQLAF